MMNSTLGIEHRASVGPVHQRVCRCTSVDEVAQPLRVFGRRRIALVHELRTTARQSAAFEKHTRHKQQHGSSAAVVSSAMLSSKRG